MGRLPGKPWKIYLIPADGGVLQPLLREGWSEWFPGWMPDGNSLVFCREISHQVSEEEKSSKHPLVWIMDLRSRQTRTIPGTEIADCPRVSPDGRYLVLTCFGKVMLYDFSTQQWEEVARDGEFRLPSWSHDSKYVYFCDWKSQDDLYDRVGIRDRKRERVVNLGGIVGGSLFGMPWVGLTPDEAPLAPLGETNQQIFAIDWKAP